jgi:hypothetical protein
MVFALMNGDRISKGLRPIRRDGKPSGTHLWKLQNEARSTRAFDSFSRPMREEFERAKTRESRSYVEGYDPYGTKGELTPEDRKFYDGGGDGISHHRASWNKTFARGTRLREPDRVGQALRRRHEEREAAAKRELDERLARIAAERTAKRLADG